MAINPTHARWRPYKLLLIWFEERDITLLHVAKELGLKSDGAVRFLLQNETMPQKHHARLVALGVPPDLLPAAKDKKPGPTPKIPRWPTLEQHQQAV